MKYKQGECYAKTHWYNASVLFFEDADKEVEIECSIQSNFDNNTGGEDIIVNIINPEDIPKEYDETDIIYFVIENFE